MLDHVSLGVSDMPRAREFYDAVLAPLGCQRLYDVEAVASAYGPKEPFYQFWISLPLDETRPVVPANGSHIALQAPDRAAVDGFHAAALAQGGGDAGAPGLRPEYMETYYAAFVLDPDGHKIEAVCYAPA